MTLEQWLKIWLETYLTDVKKSTVAQYEYQIRVHIVPEIGSYKGGQYKLVTLKNDRVRVIKPASFVFNELHKIKAVQEYQQKLCKGEWQNHYGLVFTDSVGNSCKRVRYTIISNGFAGSWAIRRSGSMISATRLRQFPCRTTIM